MYVHIYQYYNKHTLQRIIPFIGENANATGSAVSALNTNS